MPNYLDSLVAHAGVGLMVEHLGERDAQGDLATITYHPPSGDALELVGCVLHDLRISDEIEDAHGTHLRDEIEEILELNIPRVQTWGAFDPKTEAKFTVLRYAGVPFTLQEVLSLSSSWARIRATRAKVTGIRRGGALREQDR